MVLLEARRGKQDAGGRAMWAGAEARGHARTRYHAARGRARRAAGQLMAHGGVRRGSRLLTLEAHCFALKNTLLPR